MRSIIASNFLKSILTPSKRRRLRESTAAYEFDAVTGRLRIGEREVTLRPKTAAVLAALTSEPARIFSKEELLDRVWPGVHVQEQAVFQCVNEIRQAFQARECIRTHARLGYQWVGLTSPQMAPGAPRLPCWYSAAAICAFAILLAVAVSLGVPWAQLEGGVRIAVLPIASESSAPRDGSLSLGLMEMINRHGRAMEGARVVPARDVLGILEKRSPRDTTGIRRALKADYIVIVSASRDGESLVAEFAIEGRMGRVEGAVDSPSLAWLAQQIAYEIEDTRRYSLTPDAQPDRIARHQELIAAKRLLNAFETVAAERMLSVIAAGDPLYLSAQYFSMLARRELGTPVRSDEITRLLQASREKGDRVNEIRALLLSAGEAAQTGDHFVSAAHMNAGRALAARYDLHFLGAAFDFESGIASVTEGAFDRAIAAFEQAAAQYESAECAIGLVMTLRRLKEAYRSAGALQQAQAVSARIRAIETILPKATFSGVTRSEKHRA